MNNPSPTSTPRRPSAAGKYFFMLLLGLVAGAIATVMLMRALDARKDHFPESVMTVMGHHMGAMKKNVERKMCTANDVLPHLEALRVMGADIDAFDGVDDNFKKLASDFRGAVEAARNQPPLSCESMGKTLGDIGGTCKACHDQYNK